MAQHTTRPTLVKATERRLFVLSLRRSGAHYRDIAATALQHFGADRLPKNYDHRRACEDVMIELRRIADETSVHARILRAQEVDRLDRMLAAIWSQVVGGHLGAIDRAIRLAERRAKLLGIDMPSRVEINVPEADIDRLVDELLAQRAAAADPSTDSGESEETDSGGGDDLA